MKILLFILGYLTGRIISDIEILLELREVDYDKKNPRIFRQSQASRGNAKRIFADERSIDI